MTGLGVQLCGDAHLSNFGVFASPERRLLFDLNDFDRTLPGPFEYDVKRMAASFVIAGRNNGFARADARAAALASVTASREAVAGSALVELMAPTTLTYYARLCGWKLARAHARSGDPVATAEYLGGDDAFDQSVADFCERYADQNEQDYKEFVKAVRSGRLEAVEGV